MQDTLQCYKILGIEPGCSAKRVRKAYRDLAHLWDPADHKDNPERRAEAEKMRKEIDEAYEAIRFFLPELQGSEDDVKKPVRFSRDFNEMTTETPVETTRMVMGILVALVLIMIFAWAYYLFVKGHHVAPATPVPLE